MFKEIWSILITSVWIMWKIFYTYLNVLYTSKYILGSYNLISTNSYRYKLWNGAKHEYLTLSYHGIDSILTIFIIAF